MVEVKGKIQAAQNYAVEQQKLIHAGKVLKDESPLSEYGVKEGDFLVVMVTKVWLCVSWNFEEKWMLMERINYNGLAQEHQTSSGSNTGASAGPSSCGTCAYANPGARDTRAVNVSGVE